MRALRYLLTLTALTGTLCAQPGPGGPSGGGLTVVDEAATLEDKLGTRVSTDITLIDDRGYPISLEQFFPGDVPVILNLGFFGCPGLCGTIINSMVEALSDISLQPGEDFRILTVSVHPEETTELARSKKETYLPFYRRLGVESAWYFMTGEPEQTRKLASEVGFRFRWRPEENLIDHPPALVFLSPEGVVTRYLQGQVFDPSDLRLAIVEASDGEVGTFVGSFWDRIVLSCLTFDNSTGKYTLTAFTIMRIGGSLTVLAIGVMIFFLLRRERQRRIVPATT